MTESVEWERLADHEETVPEPAAASAVAPMTDERLEEIRQIAASSRAFVARHLTAALRELLAEVGRQRFEIARANQEIETLGAEVEAEHREAGEAEAKAARLRQQLQSATVLPERWRELMAERDAARRELAKVRERVAAQVTDHLRRRAHDAALADVNGYSCEAAVTWMAAAQLVESGEWKAADDA